MVIDEKYAEWLGFDLKAKLPYMLTHEDVYGEINHEVTTTPAEAGSLFKDVHLFANYLKESSVVNKDNVRPTIDEPTFVKAWLPHFHMGNEGDESRDPSVTLTWINAIAGSPYHSVDVLRNGELIFRVPPVSGRLKVIGGKDRQTSVGMLNKEMENMLTRVPHAREAQVNYLLSQIFVMKDERQSDTVTELNLKCLFTLDEIFRYYGYSTILPPEIMKIKPYIMGEQDGTESRGSLPSSDTGIAGEVSSESNFDEDDLFDF